MTLGVPRAGVLEFSAPPRAKVTRRLAPARDCRPRGHSYPGLCSGLARATPTLSPSPHAGWGLVVKLGGNVAGRAEPGPRKELDGSRCRGRIRPDLPGREPRPTAAFCLGRGGPEGALSSAW